MSRKILYLLRHSKAITEAPGGDDHARTLTLRGETDAEAMGRYFADANILPARVLCSTATRTRQTFQLLQSTLSTPLNVEYEPKLYLASTRDVLEIIAGVEPAVSSLLIIGHNPTLQQLAHDLAGNGDDALCGALSQDFPTAALAELHFQEESWQDITLQSGVLKRFITPEMFASA